MGSKSVGTTWVLQLILKCTLMNLKAGVSTSMKAVFVHVQQNSPCVEEMIKMKISSSGAACDLAYAWIYQTLSEWSAVWQRNMTHSQPTCQAMPLQSHRTWAHINTHTHVCCRWSWWSAHLTTFALPWCFAVWLMRRELGRFAVFLFAICFYHQGGVKVQRKLLYVRLLYMQDFRFDLSATATNQSSEALETLNTATESTKTDTFHIIIYIIAIVLSQSEPQLVVYFL